MSTGTLFESPVDFSVSGKVALVTGGGQGIGLAVGAALRKFGGRVYLADRTVDVGVPAAESIGATFLDLDVTSNESVSSVVSDVVSDAGRLDVAVNCAGITHARPAEELTDEEWHHVLAVNTDGVFRSCREEGKVMLAQRSGSIVNIASMSASIVNRPQKHIAYNTSKAAVVMITKSLAVEWAMRGVRVNCISPGYVETAMTAQARTDPESVRQWLGYTPMERICNPHEIAAGAVFLASSASSFITAHDLLIDGGYTAL